MKRILTAVLMLATLMILCVGCGKGKDVSGTYKLDSRAGMSTADLQKAYDEAGMQMDVASMFSVELKSDKTFTIKYGDETQSGTYKVDGEKISLTIDNDTQDGTIKDGVLTIGEGDEQMVFKK